jgi:hypothetical protein
MLETLSNFPLSFNIIKEWMILKIKENHKGDFPDEFRVYIESKNVHIQMLNDVLTHNPGILFSVLDANNVFISIYRDFEDNCFKFSIDGIKLDSKFDDRNSADKSALINGVKVLEKNLSSVDELTE